MKRILIVTNRFTMGGVETTLLTLLRNYSKEEYDVTLGLCCKGGELENCIPDGIKVVYLLPFNPMALPKVFSQLFQLFLLLMPKWMSRRLFIRSNYDSVIAYSGNMIYYLKGFKGKKICWIHDDWFPFKTQNHIIGKIRKKKTLSLLSECDNVVCVSNHLKNMLIEYSEHRLKNVKFLPNPIDAAAIIAKGSQKCDFDFELNKLYFVSVGRLHPVKGYERLINIMSRMRVLYDDFELLIIGTGDEDAKLKKLVEEKNAQEYIKFLGFQSNPYKFVSKCDMYICSSFMEGYSTTVCEAMILGNGIVSTNCGGADQILEDGKYGVLTQNSEDDLEKGIRMILDNRELVQEYRELSCLRAKELFDLKKSVDNIQTIAFVSEGMYRGGRKDIN